jgi:chemotaxis protein CheY-P-specific phosphatase CheC
MENEIKQSFEEHLKGAFESGYSNAAKSLSQLTRVKINFNNFHFGFHRLESENLNENPLFSRVGANVLITTEIFGDLTGKSYLLLSDKEFEILTGGIPDSKDPKVNLKEEFIKEMDNILSASVITKLSNELKRKMYGDVPTLVGRVSGKIVDIIYDDFSEQTEEVYINSISFSFDGHPVFSPFFIWVIDNNVVKELA